MTNPQVQNVPTEVLRYLQGPAPEAKEFDFLIGHWNVEATRYKEDGTPALNYSALWNAVHLNEGRMIMDDFKALGPTGAYWISETRSQRCDGVGSAAQAVVAMTVPAVLRNSKLSPRALS